MSLVLRTCKQKKTKTGKMLLMLYDVGLCVQEVLFEVAMAGFK